MIHKLSNLRKPDSFIFLNRVYFGIGINYVRNFLKIVLRFIFRLGLWGNAVFRYPIYQGELKFQLPWVYSSNIQDKTKEKEFDVHDNYYVTISFNI